MIDVLTLPIVGNSVGNERRPRSWKEAIEKAEQRGFPGVAQELREHAYLFAVGKHPFQKGNSDEH